MALVPVQVVFASRRQALAYSRSGGKELSLFVPTELAVPLRSLVALDVSFSDGSAGHYFLQGVVVYHRAMARGPTQPAGLVVSFETPEQKKKGSELIAFCAGRPLSLGTATAHRRTLLSKCIVHSERGTYKGSVRDVSATGAFVAALLPRGVKEGAEVELQLKPLLGALGGKRLHAKVMWLGQKYGVLGFGARFVGPVDEIRRGLSALS
jgi:hypothetical protein